MLLVLESKSWGHCSVNYCEDYSGSALVVISGEAEDINNANGVLGKISTEYKKNKKDGSVQYWFKSVDERNVSILPPASRVTLLADIKEVFGRDKTVSLFSAIESFETFVRTPGNSTVLSTFVRKTTRGPMLPETEDRPKRQVGRPIRIKKLKVGDSEDDLDPNYRCLLSNMLLNT
eukprot:sb/3471948/